MRGCLEATVLLFFGMELSQFNVRSFMYSVSFTVIQLKHGNLIDNKFLLTVLI